ncbi:MAG: rhamnogalacturonan lyase family protein [Planctomycetota bacterium]
MRHIDGIFDEFTYSGLALNTTSLLGVHKPVLGWTRNEDQLKPDPDAFFQKYLYLGVFPMCPFPGNDHSLRPSEWVDKQYIDYGPLMTAMRGRKWVLEPYAVSVPQGNAKGNIFEVPVGFVVPVVYAGDAGNVRVVLRNKKVVNETLPVYAIHPGTDQPAVVRTSKDADSLTLDVPVKRGCAMVTLFTDSPQAVDSVLYNRFGEYERANSNSKVNMHLLPKGEYQIGSDQWGKIVRVNMLKIKDWSKVPGVKKAWVMKGFEGVEGMAFHPVISDVKDVDGDGKSDIFRCRSEREDARIERLGYDDGSVVWVSEPMAALHGDESRLPVFDLDGDGVYSVLHATKGGTWCISAKTGKTEWSVKEALGDIVVGHFLDKEKRAVVVRKDAVLRCYDDKGKFIWEHDTKLDSYDVYGDAYGHGAYRCDADGDGLDEIFINWQKLTIALEGDGTVLWEDKSQKHHSDYMVFGDLDADGRIELVYDHEGCMAEKGPAYVVDAMTGWLEFEIDYRSDGLRHAQNAVLGDFDPRREGLEIAMCGKVSNLFMWDSKGQVVWRRAIPTSLLSTGDWDGDGVEDIACHGLGANVDGMFSIWNGRGQRLYAISYLPSPSRRTWSDKHKGGSWSHAMPGGHEGLDRQVDLDGNSRTDFIVAMGAWHWGSDSILFLMEGP